MRCWIVMFLVSSGLVAGEAFGGTQLSTFTDPAQFAEATSAFGMALEDFEQADVAPATITRVASPLSSATGNEAFAVGAIAPGVEIQSVPLPGDISVLGVGSEYFSIGPAASKLVVADSDAHAFDLLFSPPVTAVGVTVFSESDGAGISYFGDAGLIAALPIAAPDDTGGFFGIVSSEPIVRVRVNAPNVSDTGNFEGIDDLRFGRQIVVFSNGFE